MTEINRMRNADGGMRNDPYLRPYEKIIRARMRRAEVMAARLTEGGKIGLGDFASGHEYFGLHNLENQADSAKVATTAGRPGGCSGNGRPMQSPSVSLET